MLSVGGGLLGIALGLCRVRPWSRGWSSGQPSSRGLRLQLSFGISAAVGIVFGFYPARQASRVSPDDFAAVRVIAHA